MAEAPCPRCKNSESCSRDSCVFNDETKATFLELNCQLNHYIHKFSCCSARLDGSKNVPCHDGREGIADEVLRALACLKLTIKKVEEEAMQHAENIQASSGLHRVHKGRELVTRDSGIDSTCISSGFFVNPIQEEPTTTTREPTENKDTSDVTADNSLAST